MIDFPEPLTLETALVLIAELRGLVQQQAVRIAELEEKIRKDSSNSSKPPSSDGPAKRKFPEKKPSGRAPGGQPGHKKHPRVLLPVEKARSVRDVKPAQCERCGKALGGVDAVPRRHQVVDLPPIEPVFDEWRLHTLVCTDASCGHLTAATLPDDVSTLGYGPGVDAMVGQWAGEMRASKRTTAETMTNVFGVPMSTGAVIDAQHRVSAALATPCDEAVDHAQRQPIKNADETPWKQEKSKAYIWVCVTAFVTVFVIQTSRAAKVAGALLGTVRGILGTDRYSGYAWWPAKLRQVCWAHLVRDFRALAERGGSSEQLGKGLLEQAEAMFGWWKKVRAGELSRTTFQVYMRKVRQEVEDLLAKGCADAHPKTARTCQKMGDVREAFWTFVTVEGVEPTNNAAEQALRFGVLWRKRCYGTKSKEGSLFVARILTVHATLRRQNRNVYAFLRQACQAHRTGQEPPALVPKAAA